MNTQERLTLVFLQSHPEDAARILEGTSTKEAAQLLSDCDLPVSVGVIHRMTGQVAAACLLAMEVDKAATLLDQLPLTVASDIMRRIEPEKQTNLLAQLPENSRKPLMKLLGSAEMTAGALVDPLVFTLPHDITVAEARKRIEDSAQKIHYYLYVVDRDEKLVGILNLRDFVLAKSDATIAAIMKSKVQTISSELTLKDLLASPLWTRFQSLPVVDHRSVFLGVIGLEKLRQYEQDFVPVPMSDKAWETLLALGELYWVGMAGMFSGKSPDFQSLDTILSRRKD